MAERRRIVVLALVGALAVGCGSTRHAGAPRTTSTAAVSTTTAQPAAGGSAGGARGFTVVVPAPAPIVHWNADSTNQALVTGQLLFDGHAVRGATLSVGGFVLGAPTDHLGRFRYAIDDTTLGRAPIRVAGLEHAAVAGSGARPARSPAAALGAFSAAFAVLDLRAGRDAHGNPTVSGRLAYADGSAPATVALYSYLLTGRVVDEKGDPVVGARVSTRTLDRDYWTVSQPTDEHGDYRSVFVASSENTGNPVPFNVRVVKGDLVWQFLPDENVLFARDESARLDLRLPPANYPLALPLPTSFPGATYQGVVAGVSAGDSPVTPLAATWPDRRGRFTLTLPKRLRGARVAVWETVLDAFSRTRAVAGGPIPSAAWPTAVPDNAPRRLAQITLR